MTPVESILINARNIPEPLVGATRAACARASLEGVLWPGEGQAPTLPHAPMLLVAGLQGGVRRIPDELVETITRIYPGLPLLLLCDEALVRPTLSMQDGAINLLGPPLTSARVAQRIDALLHDRRKTAQRQETLPMGVSPFAQPVVCITNERARWWTATLTCRGSKRFSTGLMVDTRTSLGSGITAVVPFPDGAEGRGAAQVLARVDEVVAVAAEARKSPGKERMLVELLASDAGVIHLNATADEWFICWPRKDAPLLLCSPIRLPRCWDLTRRAPSGGAQVLRLPAVGGDLLMALSSPLEIGAAKGELADLEEMTANGGTAAAALLERRLRESPIPVAGMLVEVY